MVDKKAVNKNSRLTLKSLINYLLAIFTVWAGKIKSYQSVNPKAVESGQEVAECKKIEDVLHDNEQRLENLIFSIADWVWEVDEKGVYTYSSYKSSEFFGRSPEEMIGKTPFDFMPPDEAKRVSAIFFEILANKAPIKDLENWNIQKTGRKICLLTNGVPIFDKSGNFKGYLGVDKDITERRVMENALRVSQERFMGIFENINMGISIMDTNYRILKVNSHIGRLFNRSPEDFEGKLCFSEFENRDGICAHCPGSIVMRGKPTEKIEAKGVRKDGSYFYVNIWAVGTYDKNGVCTGFIELVEDITERKKIEEEAKKRLHELEIFYRISMDREERIIALKNEVESLKRKLAKQD